MASIGLPAVTLPSSGTSTTLSSFSKYSFGTNNSIVLFLDESFFIYPFSSNLFKWNWVVAEDERPILAPISLTVGGYPLSAIDLLIISRISFCLSVNFPYILLMN